MVTLLTEHLPPPPPRSLLLSVVLAWCGVDVCFLLLQASAGGRWLFCSRQFDCRAVLSSKYAVAWGIPLPWLGAAFYFSILALLLLALAVHSSALRENILKWALWIGVVGVTFTAGLVYVQFAVLHAFCGLCMTSAIIVVALATSIFQATRKNSPACPGHPEISLMIGIFVIMGGVAFYLLQPVPPEEIIAEIGSRKLLRREMEQDLREQLQPLKANVRMLEREWVKKKIDETLLAFEAKKRGVPAEQILSGVGVDGGARLKFFGELAQVYGVRSYLAARAPGPLAFDLSKGETLGPSGAQIELVVFSDYTCKYCVELDKVLRMVRNKFPNILIAHRDFPLTENGEGFLAAVAARCAAEQGAYWKYHDRLFDENGVLPEQKLVSIAVAVGLDQTRFSECLGSDRARKFVQASFDDATQNGVAGTPAIFLNGVMVGGMIEYQDLEKKILAELRSTQRP